MEKNNTEAVELLRRSAAQGYISAIRVLANVHERGHMGLEPDQDKARELVERAAAEDDPWALRRLADAYEKGELGLAVDPGQAAALRARLPQPTKKGMGDK